MFQLVIAYNDHQYPTVEVFMPGKGVWHKLLLGAREDKGMSLKDYEEAFKFALECLKVKEFPNVAVATQPKE